MEFVVIIVSVESGIAKIFTFYRAIFTECSQTKPESITYQLGPIRLVSHFQTVANKPNTKAIAWAVMFDTQLKTVLYRLCDF